MVKSKVWIMKTKFHGFPKPTDFAIQEEELAEIKDGEARTEAIVWSVDPFNRAYMDRCDAGTDMIGFQLAKVVESKNSKFKVGDHVITTKGWRTLANIESTAPIIAPYVVPDIGGLPLSLTVGVLGMPEFAGLTCQLFKLDISLNMTAYFGLLDLCKPQPGETVLVNAAAGAVGSAVGQIAKIKGCRAVGFAGSDDKVAWLKEVGFDAAYNYKKVKLADAIKEGCPKGVDCFFDNVGGDFADTVYPFLNMDARIAQCGAISGYNATEQRKIVDFRPSFIGRRISLHGLYVTKWEAQWPEGIKQMTEWVHQGRMKYQETKYHGFEKMPQSLIEQLEGKNNGKSVVIA